MEDQEREEEYWEPCELGAWSREEKSFCVWSLLHILKRVFFGFESSSSLLWSRTCWELQWRARGEENMGSGRHFLWWVVAGSSTNLRFCQVLPVLLFCGTQSKELTEGSKYLEAPSSSYSSRCAEKVEYSRSWSLLCSRLCTRFAAAQARGRKDRRVVVVKWVVNKDAAAFSELFQQHLHHWTQISSSSLHLGAVPRGRTIPGEEQKNRVVGGATTIGMQQQQHMK